MEIAMELILILFEVWKNASEAPSNISDTKVLQPRHIPKCDRNCLHN